jgi:uncharacterized protein YndB with AHSA1/START domain
MTETATIDAYGALTEPETLTIQRLLPGPVERVWAYLTQSDLRARWLAAGEMELRVGAPVEFVWRNDELTDPPGRRPEGSGGKNRLSSRITEVDPPRRLAFEWGDSGDVVVELAPQGDGVLLTLTHRRLRDRAALLDVSSGWHAHLDILAARLAGRAPAPFWDEVRRLRQDYDRRLPA